MRDLLIKKGYIPGQSCFTLEDEGAIHPESAWAPVGCRRHCAFLLQSAACKHLKKKNK